MYPKPDVKHIHYPRTLSSSSILFHHYIILQWSTHLKPISFTYCLSHPFCAYSQFLFPHVWTMSPCSTLMTAVFLLPLLCPPMSRFPSYNQYKLVSYSLSVSISFFPTADSRIFLQFSSISHQSCLCLTYVTSSSVKSLHLSFLFLFIFVLFVGLLTSHCSW